MSDPFKLIKAFKYNKERVITTLTDMLLLIEHNRDLLKKNKVKVDDIEKRLNKMILQLNRKIL